MKIYIPENYRPALPPGAVEQAIRWLRLSFEEELSVTLNLRRVTAPLFVFSGTGINDDLNGTEHAVSFPVRDMDGRRAEVVHSLAKWKRLKLAHYRVPPGEGVCTNMNAIRAGEELDNTHSLYVDQWDWEKTLTPEERTLDCLKSVVDRIYGVARSVERQACAAIPQREAILPEKIVYVHSEDLLAAYPDLSPRAREREVAREYGAVFVIGIGMKLADGRKHDGRAPDYDDWSTPTCDGHYGLNGDMIFWNPVLNDAFELSSMGIRVDREALLRQLALENCTERCSLAFHRALLDGALPSSIGGGIGQSRLCMFLLRCAHIGEVQSSLWPEEMIRACIDNRIFLK
ncbi:MAG: aspartate--ammonia ligase [Tannerella sp.]|jgi:aspartate--ammonia ligase|nr:aspartate--ammonia ligase [Tannerella sp.]